MAALITRLAGFTLLGLSASGALAAPWLEPGDPRVRYALQKLADRGHLNRSVTTWPVMWPGIRSALEQKGSADGDEGVTGALAYLQFAQKYQAGLGARDEFSIKGTTETPFATQFGSSASEEIEVQLSMEWIGESWQPGWRHPGPLIRRMTRIFGVTTVTWPALQETGYSGQVPLSAGGGLAGVTA